MSGSLSTRLLVLFVLLGMAWLSAAHVNATTVLIYQFPDCIGPVNHELYWDPITPTSNCSAVYFDDSFAGWYFSNSDDGCTSGRYLLSSWYDPQCTDPRHSDSVYNMSTCEYIPGLKRSDASQLMAGETSRWASCVNDPPVVPYIQIEIQPCSASPAPSAPTSVSAAPPSATKKKDAKFVNTAVFKNDPAGCHPYYNNTDTSSSPGEWDAYVKLNPYYCESDTVQNITLYFFSDANCSTFLYQQHLTAGPDTCNPIPGTGTGFVVSCFGYRPITEGPPRAPSTPSTPSTSSPSNAPTSAASNSTIPILLLLALALLQILA